MSIEKIRGNEVKKSRFTHNKKNGRNTHTQFGAFVWGSGEGLKRKTVNTCAPKKNRHGLSIVVRYENTYRGI